jgi:SAM-dependent methyltransferase
MLNLIRCAGLFLLLIINGFCEDSDLGRVLDEIKRQTVYQDIIINDEVVAHGWGPNCAARYEALRPILEQYNRPITVLEIGANHGYFSLRIAHDFDSSCVMIDFTERLLDICKLNTDRHNIIHLKKCLTLDEIVKLSQTEHFDVVLAMHVLHHMNPWQEYLKAIFHLGDNVIIETPPADDAVVPQKPSVPFIEAYLLTLPEGKIIAETERYTKGTYSKMFWFPGSKTTLDRKTWTSRLMSPEEQNALRIESSYTHKTLIKERDGQKIERKWLKGINFETFKGLNGIYPTTEVVSGEINRIQHVDPQALESRNVIIQGNRLRRLK